jgi:hypothetical protein
VATISGAPAEVSKDGVLKVTLACPTEAVGGCVGTVAVKLRGAKKKTATKPKGGSAVLRAARRRPPTRRHFKIAAGKTAGVSVSLSRRALRRLSHRRHPKAQITVTMKTAKGTTTSTRVISLRRTFKKKKPKHRH